MTPKQQAIANYVHRRISVGRVHPGTPINLYPVYLGPHHGALPDHQTLAAAYLADEEFRALELGSWLGSPTGAFIAEAVALVIPAALQPEFNLIVDALKLAADRQKGETWGQIIERGAVGLVAVLVVTAILRHG